MGLQKCFEELCNLRSRCNTSSKLYLFQGIVKCFNNLLVLDSKTLDKVLILDHERLQCKVHQVLELRRHKISMKTHCAKHVNEIFISFCKTCDCFFCLQCLEQNDHQGHQFMSLAKLLQDRQEHLQTIENKEMHLDSRASEEENNISQRAETLHLNIDSTKAKLSEELNQYVNEHKKHLSDMKMDFKNEIKILTKIINASKRDASSTEDDEQETTDSPQCHLSSSPRPPKECNIPRFSFRNDSDVSEVFGTFEKEIRDSGDADDELKDGVSFEAVCEMPTGTVPVDETENSKLNQSLQRNFSIAENRDGIIRIRRSPCNNSWITVCRSKKISLYSKDGSNIKNISTSFRVFDIGVNQKQELFATEASGRHVWKFSQRTIFNSKWSKFASFPENYVTNGIYVNDSSDIWICLQNEQFWGKVVRLSQSGVVSQEIEFNKEKERLFKQPRLVHQNTCTGDILIVDGRKIVVVDKLGVLMFQISGSSLQTVDQIEESVSSDKFTPLGLANDKTGNIIISDFGNNKVWMFDKAGKFMRNLHESPSGPTGIILYSEEELLVALSDGQIVFMKI